MEQLAALIRNRRTSIPEPNHPKFPTVDFDVILGALVEDDTDEEDEDDELG